VIIDTLQTSIVNNLQLHDGILVGGVDEAGRGSIIGPLVVAGVSIRESKIIRLSEMGVKDSKALTPKARARLFGEIMEVVDHVCVRKINPLEVDDSVSLHGLNRLEAKVMASVINKIMADEVYVDCCDVNPERYGDYIVQHLKCSPKVHSMHHADAINVVVSAASIIAKITRDQEVQHIRAVYRSIGSGYPSDDQTMRFIRRWVKKNGAAPEFARKSWKPLKIMLEQMTQQKL
jgi:ribonuclease HII